MLDPHSSAVRPIEPPIRFYCCKCGTTFLIRENGVTCPVCDPLKYKQVANDEYIPWLEQRIRNI